jgi:hypothetical protein
LDTAVRGPLRLEKGREVAALAELRDFKFDSADPCLPGALAISIALVDAGSRSLAVAALVRLSSSKLIMQLPTYPIISLRRSSSEPFSTRAFKVI